MTQIILNICFGLNIIIKKKQEINKIEKKLRIGEKNEVLQL